MPSAKLESVDGPRGATSLADVAAFVPLGPEAKQLAAAEANVASLLDRLCREKRFADSLRLLPYLLPIRRAVWWSCLCTWHACDTAPSPNDDRVLGTAVRWARMPTEANAAAAWSASQADSLDTAASCCARAAGCAGVQAEPGADWQPRETILAARLCAGAVATAMTSAEKAGRPINPEQLLLLGQEVAAGTNLWVREDEALM